MPSTSFSLCSCRGHVSGGWSLCIPWCGEESNVQPIVMVCPYQLPLVGNSSHVISLSWASITSWCQVSTTTSPCLYPQGPDFSSFRSIWLAQDMLSILLGGHRNFSGLSHLAKVPGVLCCHPDHGSPTMTTPFCLQQFSQELFSLWDILREETHVPSAMASLVMYKFHWLWQP